MNKLQVAEAMGYNCGPSGTFPAEHGTYCLRPIYNPRGMLATPFYEVEYTGEGEDLLRPGYFWCEWFEGERTWSEYINDRFVYGTGGMEDETGLLVAHDLDARPMPAQFKGISRYMLIECIGGKVIEVACRMMGGWGARQAVIDNYRTIDPSYDPQDINFGKNDWQIHVMPDGGFQWMDTGKEL